MLSFFMSRDKWCQPGKGPMKEIQYWQALPQGAYQGAAIDSVQYFLRNVENFGFPPKLRQKFGEISFRFIVHCSGPSGKLSFYFAVPDIRKMGFQSAFEAAFPDIYLIPIEKLPNLVSSPMEHLIAAEGLPARKGPLSILPFISNDHPSPLHDVLPAMGAGKLAQGEEVWLDLTFWPAKNEELTKFARKAERWMLSSEREPFSLREVWNELKANHRMNPEISKAEKWSEQEEFWMQELQEKKQSGEKGLWTCFRLYMVSPQSKPRFQTMTVALEAMKAFNALRFHPVSVHKMNHILQDGSPTRGLLLTTKELAGWMHIPGMQHAASAHVEKARSKIISAPSDITKGIFIGKSNVPGETREIRIPMEQMLKHTFLAGTTGSGKTSTLLSVMLHMVKDLIHFPNEAPGFTFLDPHGGAIRTLLSLIPKSLHPKVHVVPLGVTTRPRGFNLFQADQAEQAEEITGEFVATLQQLFPGARPRAEHYLRSGLLSLLHCPPQTVLGISHVFLNEKFRKGIIPRLDMHLRHFWTQEFAQIKNISDHLGPILNKLGALTTYPSSRRMLGQKRTFYPTRKVMDEGHIVLIDGSGCVPDLLKIISSLFFSAPRMAIN